MSAEPGFAAALRNFSTLFLMAFFVFAPLHMAVAFRWQNAISTEPTTQTGTTGKDEAGAIDPGHLAAHRRARVVIAVLELLLLPVLVAGTARVLEREEEGGVPTVPDAVTHLAGRPFNFLSRRAAASLALGGLATAVAVLALYSIFSNVLSLVGGSSPPWALRGLVDAGIRAAAMPFFLGPAAYAARDRRRR